jgi:hypothetical protein
MLSMGGTHAQHGGNACSAWGERMLSMGSRLRGNDVIRPLAEKLMPVRARRD